MQVVSELQSTSTHLSTHVAAEFKQLSSKRGYLPNPLQHEQASPPPSPRNLTA